VIRLYHVSKVYPPRFPALTDLSLAIEAGEFILLTGPSGAGKTTLLRLVLGAEAPTAGQIVIGGRNLARTKKWRDIGREPRVAFVVDDVLPPWRPRMIEIRGLAVRLSEGGTSVVASFAPELIRITPTRIVSYAINGDEGSPDLHGGGRDVRPSPERGSRRG